MGAYSAFLVALFTEMYGIPLTVYLLGSWLGSPFPLLRDTHAGGPYAWVRHPRYDGFLLIMVGFLLQWPTIPTLVMFPILVYVYARPARSEEHEVAARFGEQWAAYARLTPAFWPRLRHWAERAARPPEGDR